MSVIIKNMDMPTECGTCKLWGSCGLIKSFPPSKQIKVFVDKIRLTECPLEEIPDREETGDDTMEI